MEKLSKGEQIDKKLVTMGPIKELMEAARITKDDVGKFFVMSKDKKSGQIMTFEQIMATPIDEIGGQDRIGQLDVNC